MGILLIMQNKKIVLCFCLIFFLGILTINEINNFFYVNSSTKYQHLNEKKFFSENEVKELFFSNVNFASIWCGNNILEIWLDEECDPPGTKYTSPTTNEQCELNGSGCTWNSWCEVDDWTCSSDCLCLCPKCICYCKEEPCNQLLVNTTCFGETNSSDDCVNPDANNLTSVNACSQCYSGKHSFNEQYKNLGWGSGTKPYCCGDDNGEYLISTFGNTACCPSLDYQVNDQNECVEQGEICGDGIIVFPEECEINEDCDSNEVCTNCSCVENIGQEICNGLDDDNDGEIDELFACVQNEKNSFDCPQSINFCNNGRTGVRDSLGNCNNSCSCIEDSFSYSCVIGECGANCASNEDCGEEEYCNLSDCSCHTIEETNNCPDVLLNIKNIIEKTDGLYFDLEYSCTQSTTELNFEILKNDILIEGDLSIENCNETPNFIVVGPLLEEGVYEIIAEIDGCPSKKIFKPINSFLANNGDNSISIPDNSLLLLTLIPIFILLSLRFKSKR